MNSSTSISFRARFIVIAVVGVMLGLTGCAPGDPPEASQTGPSSASPSVTATPTPTPVAAYKPATSTGRAENVPVPVLPEAAKANSKEGLEAFARYWFQTLSYAYETGETSIVEKISGPNCTFCTGLQDNLRLMWADGRWLVGGQLQTPSVTGKVVPGAETQQATVQVIHQPLTIYNPDGTPYQEPTKGSNRASQMVAAFDGGGWTVVDLGLIR